jgi:hypothetical protein
MAKILKCPRCQEKIDVTDLSGGSTVRCDACGTMVRISGGTQPIPKAAPAPAPAPAARERGTTKVRKPGEKNTTKVRTNPGAGRQTDLFRKMSSARAPGEGGRPRGGRDKEIGGGSNTGMIIAIAAAAVVVIAIIAVVVMKKDSGSGKASASEGRDRDSSSSSPKKKKKDEQKAAAPRPAAPVGPADTGVFRPGARVAAGVGKDVPDMKCNPDSRQAYEAMVTGGKTDQVVAEDFRWITYVFDGLLSDNEGVFKGTCEALHKIILKRKLDASQSDLGKQSTMNGSNVPEFRGNEYTYWAQWWLSMTNRNAVATWAEQAGVDPSAAKPDGGGGVQGNASTENWPVTLAECRSGGFQNEKNPEHFHFLRVKSMGKSAYPKLVEFIDNEDSTIGKAAVLFLIELTGRTDANPRVNDGNKAQIKADWAEYIKK